MRAMANDREITATLGVPVRRVEAAAWFGCGVLAGLAGLLLADLVALDATTLTFLVISSLAAALIARLRSIPVTFVAAIVIGLVDDLLTPITVAHQLPRHDAVRARRDRAAGAVAAPGHGRSPARRPSRRCDTAGREPPADGQRHPAAPGRPAADPRACVIAVLLLFVLFALPPLLSLYYIDAMTQVAIYSIVALGLGLLVGRVGLVSLGQGAVLAIGAWVAARLLFATSLPFPLVLLEAGLITMVLGTRSSGCPRCGCAACTWR